jgi:hypothetical protein
LAICVALALGALVLAGCGGSSGASSSSTAETSTTAISTEARACLKKKGVELPEFKSGEGGQGAPKGGEPGQMLEGGEMPGGEAGPPADGFGGAGSEEMTEAFEECGVEIPAFKGGPGGEGGAPDTNSTAFKTQVKEYVACVRENGYELAEPDFSGEGPVFAQEESESAAFKKASAQCQGLLGGPQPSSAESGTET